MTRPKSLLQSTYGKTLATSGGWKTLRLTDIDTGNPRVLCGSQLSSTSGDSMRVRNLQFSFDGKTLVSGDENGNIILWDLETGKAKNHFSSHLDRIKSTAFSLDGKLLVSNSQIKPKNYGIRIPVKRS